jgi:hypothetical protein
MKNGTQEISTQPGLSHPTYLQALRQNGRFLNDAGHTSDAEEVEARIARLESAPGIAQAKTGSCFRLDRSAALITATGIHVDEFRPLVRLFRQFLRRLILAT